MRQPCQTQSTSKWQTRSKLGVSALFNPSNLAIRQHDCIQINCVLKSVFQHQHTKQILPLQVQAENIENVQANNFYERNQRGTDFRKMNHRLQENEAPTLGKSATNFGKISHRLWENQPPTLAKSATDLGKISHRLWENEPPTLGK